MSAKVLKGSLVVETMNEWIAQESSELMSQGIVPTLAIVRVGEREDDISYERGATKRAEKVGVAIKNVTFPEDVSLEVLIRAIHELNGDASVHGVLMFRPLPNHIDEDQVRNALDPAKDIDGITDLSLAGVFSSTDIGFAPCTAQACMEILDFFGCELKGKKVVVVGRSLVVGKPVAMMLLDRNATVTVAHSRTRNLPGVCREADIIVSCVGRFCMLDESYLSEGQTIIDVGINFDEEGTMAGDVEFDCAEKTVGAITPVPGGVGTVTTSTLMKHVVQAARKIENGQG